MKLNAKNRVSTPFGDFQVDVENLVGQLFGENSADGRTQDRYDSADECCSTAWTPRISVVESETDYQMVVELPGVDPAEVSVEMQEGRLEISGEKKAAELVEGVSSLRDERLSGAFKRVFEFAKMVEPDGIQAEFKNGLLKIELPKSARVLPRKIDIQVDKS